MKLKFSKLLMGYTGKIDDKTIYYSPSKRRYILRSIPEFKEGENHKNFGAISKNLYALNPSPEYIQNLREYRLQYNSLPGYRERPASAWNLLYMKLMWNMKYIMGVDLETLDRSLALELPCRTVAEAIENRLLPMVKDYERFTALI